MRTTGLSKMSIVTDEAGEETGKVLKVIARSGVSSILFRLYEKPKRFSELMFETHLNPGILDRHLKALIDCSLVEKGDDRYMLTDKGKKVVEALRELFRVLEG